MKRYRVRPSVRLSVPACCRVAAGGSDFGGQEIDA